MEPCWCDPLSQIFPDANYPALGSEFARVPLRISSGEQVGDLGSKLGKGPEVLEIIAPSKPCASQVFANRITNEGSVRFYINPSLLDRRAVVLHDSFTNWIVPMISELFSETLLIHCADFDFEFCDQYKPAFVWHFQIERFFVRVPKNGVSWCDWVGEQEDPKRLFNAVR